MPAAPSERVEVGDRVGRRSRLRRRIAAARRLADRRSRPIVGANLGERRRPRRRRSARRRRGFGPVGRGRLGARDDDDGRRPVAPAFHVHLAAAADIDGTGRIRSRGDGRSCGGEEKGGEARPAGRALCTPGSAGAAACQKSGQTGYEFQISRAANAGCTRRSCSWMVCWTAPGAIVGPPGFWPRGEGDGRW